MGSESLHQPTPSIGTSSNDDDDSDRYHQSSGGHASVSQTIINMTKTCMGTGCLALPFAAKQGGILLHVFGLIAVAIWGTITVHLLCQCYDLTHPSNINNEHTYLDDNNPDDQESLLLKRLSTSFTATGEETTSADSMSSYQSINQNNIQEMSPDNTANENNVPPKGTTTLSKLAWFACGPVGATTLDIVMVVYLVGVIVTYLNATRSFLQDTMYYTTGIGVVDSLLLAAVMGSLSIVPHTGYLAKASVVGLAALLLSFCVIAWYGFLGGGTSVEEGDRWSLSSGDAASDSPAVENASTSSSTSITDFLLPINGLAGVSQWFGCVVFGFGVTPLTFNFKEAMAEPHHLLLATKWSMLAVAIVYTIFGLGLLWLFPHIHGDVLHELPAEGWVPTATRLAMVLVVLATAPLIIVPCGEIIEKRLLVVFNLQTSRAHHIWRYRVIVRWSICLVCATISAMVPGFVDVLSFVGCCCVAVVGFCLPPFLHLVLTWQRGTPVASLGFDMALLVWGVLATVVSTVYTFQEVSK